MGRYNFDVMPSASEANYNCTVCHLQPFVFIRTELLIPSWYIQLPATLLRAGRGDMYIYACHTGAV